MDLLSSVFDNPFLFIFAPNQPPGHKIKKHPRIKRFKKMNNSNLSHITLYLEDGHKPANFNGKTKSFTCLLIKK